MMGLLGGDKKKAISLILSESQKPKEKEVSQGLEGDFSKAHELIAKDLIDGLKSDDPGKVSRSLKQFFQMCEREDEYSEPAGE